MSGPAAPPSFYCKGRTGEYVELLDLFKPLSEIPEMDTSYFKPWTLGMLYEVEPELEAIATRAVAQKRRRYPAKRTAYVQAKDAAWKLAGWYARDPRLRSKEAWDCLFRYILDELNI